jgi:hypothetical protein
MGNWETYINMGLIGEVGSYRLISRETFMKLVVRSMD